MGLSFWNLKLWIAIVALIFSADVAGAQTKPAISPPTTNATTAGVQEKYDWSAIEPPRTMEAERTFPFSWVSIFEALLSASLITVAVVVLMNRRSSGR